MSIIPINELIINKNIINKIKTTIKKYKKPLLLVGPSSIGKTTAILSVANSLKYKITNIDPYSNYKLNKKNIFIKNEIILLDNLDEITSIKIIELVDYFVKDGRPLIMCTSNVHKNLQNIKKKLNIRATNYLGFELTEWVNYLTNKYKEISRKNIKNLVKQTKFNKGIALNLIKLKLTDLNGYQMTNNMTMWEVFENAFNKSANRSDYYFRENMFPVYIFDNYPRLKKNSIYFCENTSNECCNTDIIETFYKKKQYYEFMPYVNMFTTKISTFNYNEKINFVRFPEYYGKIKKKINGKASLKLEEILKSKRGKKYIKTEREKYEDR